MLCLDDREVFGSVHKFNYAHWPTVQLFENLYDVGARWGRVGSFPLLSVGFGRHRLPSLSVFDVGSCELMRYSLLSGWH